MICKIQYNKFKEISILGNEIYNLYFYDQSMGEIYEFSYVYDIKIIYSVSTGFNIYIQITKLLQNKIDINNYVAYETNVTSIPDIISDTFNMNFNGYSNQFSCFFKKSTGTNLVMLCLANKEGNYSLSEIKQEKILSNIKFTYKFIIQPVNSTEVFTVQGNGGYLIFGYPNIIDFYDNDYVNIYYYGKGIEYLTNIKLNNDSNDLKCELTLSGKFKKCIIDKSHFIGKSNGLYYTYHKNYFDDYSIIYELSPFQVLLPEESEIIIKIKKEDNNDIKFGYRGYISFISDYDDKDENLFDISDIENQTLFKANFIGSERNHKVYCKIWKPENEKIRVICNFDDYFTNSHIKIKLNKSSFIYKKRKITLYSDDYININQLNSQIAFLYSDKQEINIDNNNDEYSLIFKEGIYRNETLILYKNRIKNIKLICSEESEKQIIECKVKKNELLKILSYNNEKYYLYQLIDNEGFLLLDNVLDIIINYDNETKIDINIKITELLTKNVDKNSYIVYETNITDIPQITTDYFNLKSNTNDNINTKNCLFKKNNDDNDKLLLLCFAEFSGSFTLGKISSINLDNINIFYNFKIDEIENYEISSISEEEGPKVYFVYPTELNFTKSNSYIINYRLENQDKFIGIKLNNKSEKELICNYREGITQCRVPKGHFKESGYYYTYYKNNYGTSSIIYEIEKVKIILNNNIPDNNGYKQPESNDNLAAIIAGSIVGGLVLIGIIVFLIYRYRRKKSTDDFTKSANLLPNSRQIELKNE